MAQPRKISDEQRKRLLAVVQLRQRIPTDQQLADECGVSRSAIRQTMSLMLAKVHDSTVTNTENAGTVGCNDPPNPPAPGP